MVLLIAGSSGLARASESLRLNVSPNGYPPYTIVADQKISGIVWDVVTRIGERLGYRIEARKIPRKRVDGMLLDGFIDATARAEEWTDAPERFVFTDPIVSVREVFFSVGQEPFDYQSPEDLAGKTVLTHLGYKYPNLHDMFNSRKALRFDVPKDRDIFSYLLHGENRFDLAISDVLVGRWLIRKNGWKGRFSTSPQALSDYGLKLMLRPDMADFAQQFNRELAAMKANGELDRILQTYR